MYNIGLEADIHQAPSFEGTTNTIRRRHTLTLLVNLPNQFRGKKTPGASGGPEGGAHAGPVADPAKPAGSGGPTVTPSAQREGD